MKLKLKQKDYSLREAFGPDFPTDQKIMGFEDTNFPFVPRRNPAWHWNRDVLRVLMEWWMDSESFDGMFLFGPHGSGKSGAIRQFCAALGIPCYLKIMHPDFVFEQLIYNVSLAGGTSIPSYAWVTLAMGAEGYPGVFCADEVDRARPALLAALHDILDGEPIDVELGGLEHVPRSPHFRIAATGNTAMSGDATGLYPSAQRQDVSFVDRFIFEKVPYLQEAQERTLLGCVVPALPAPLRDDMVRVANAIRACFMGDFDIDHNSQAAQANAAGTQNPPTGTALSPDERLPLTMSTRVLLRWARKTLAFRSAQAHGINPVWYALDRVLLNAADTRPEVRIVIKELAEGILGPAPTVT